MKSIVLATALAVASTAAFAQATQYYVVHDTTAKKCMVVTQKPAANMTSTTVVGEGKVYTSEADANNAMKTIAVCKSM
ncbi:MAG: hypothetical protein V9G24_11795 [Rhodoblastus sp.]